MLLKVTNWILLNTEILLLVLRLGEAVQVEHSLLSVCVRVCVFVCTIPRAQMKLECSNLVQIFILMNSGAGMFLRSKGQRSRSKGQ